MTPCRTTFAEMVRAAYELDQKLDVWFARAVSLFRAQLDQGFGAYDAIAVGNPP